MALRISSLWVLSVCRSQSGRCGGRAGRGVQHRRPEHLRDGEVLREGGEEEEEPSDLLGVSRGLADFHERRGKRSGSSARKKEWRLRFIALDCGLVGFGDIHRRQPPIFKVRANPHSESEIVQNLQTPMFRPLSSASPAGHTTQIIAATQ